MAFTLCVMTTAPATASPELELVDTILGGRKRTNSGMDDAKAPPPAPVPVAPTTAGEKIARPDADAPRKDQCEAAKAAAKNVRAANADPMSCLCLEQRGKKPSHIYYEARLHSYCPYAVVAFVEECDTFSSADVECKEVRYTFSAASNIVERVSSRRMAPVLRAGIPKLLAPPAVNKMK